MAAEACTEPACVQGKCVAEPRIAGTPCAGPGGDPAVCRVAGCDGKGACVERDADDGTPCSPAGPAEPCIAYACALGECVAGPACDDENPCTEDSCEGGICGYEQLNKGACDDGDDCTVDDRCFAGVCSGDVNPCDDKNACTTDACVPIGGCTHEATDDAPCDDGNPCTRNDYCKAGQCKVGAYVLCDDSNPCTDDACAKETGGCALVPNQAECEDGDVCSDGDRCSGGMCVGGPAIACDDGNACTEDACDSAQGCVHPVLPGCQPCQADDDCTDDGNPCTAERCLPDRAGDLKCTNEPLTGEPCDDKKACTVGDACADGACVPGPQKACEDGNPCTDDACDAATGQCAPGPNQRACDDNNGCTVADTCKAGACAGAPIPCSDGNPCTSDGCVPATGACLFTPTAATCDDGDPCTTSDTCTGATCSGKPVSCDDGQACTIDSCAPGIGCGHQEIPGCASCNSAADCDDRNACTNEECLEHACAFAPLNGPACDDGNACTKGDSCKAGKCMAGASLVCNDSSPCTADSCDPKIGCVFKPIGGFCEDGDGCTGPDTCTDGMCLPGANLCCAGKPDGVACSDQDGATGPDFCFSGACRGFRVVEYSAVAGMDTYIEDVDASGAEAYVAGGYMSEGGLKGFVATAPFGETPKVIGSTVVAGRQYRAVSFESAVGDDGLVAYRPSWQGTPNSPSWVFGGVLSGPLFSGSPQPVQLVDVFGVPGTFDSGAFGPECTADAYVFIGRDGQGRAFARGCRIYKSSVWPSSCSPNPKAVCGNGDISGADVHQTVPAAAAGARSNCTDDWCLNPGAFTARLPGASGGLGLFIGLPGGSQDVIDKFTLAGAIPATGGPLDMARIPAGPNLGSYVIVGEPGLLARADQGGLLETLWIPLGPDQKAWRFTNVSSSAEVTAVSGTSGSGGQKTSLLLHWNSQPLDIGWIEVPIVTCDPFELTCTQFEPTGVAVRGRQVWVVGRRFDATAGFTRGVLYFLDLGVTGWETQ
ncbi:MAG: hypothetical protein FJ087_11510 [Deltaproteobacteria bacterium]|nr:hypothetical protein [Deltaproteobacteria bacterium]